MQQLINYLVQGIIDNTNIIFFFCLLVIPEFIKMFTLYNNVNKKHIFKFDKRGIFPFSAKWMVVVLGAILAYPVFLVTKDLGDYSTKQIITQIVITYTITTSFYELFFSATINKLKQILRKISEAKVKNIEIDLSVNKNDLAEYTDYNESGSDTPIKEQNVSDKFTEDLS